MSDLDPSQEERLRLYLYDLEDGCHCFRYDQQLTVKDSNGFGDTPLHVAVRRGDTQIVEDMLNARAEINVRGERGFTALHYAVMWHNPEMVRLLLRRGASVHTVCDWGEALVDSATRSHPDVMAAVRTHML